MKIKRIISSILAAAVMLTALLCVSIPAAAASKGISVTGEFDAGLYILQVYGLTKKQYTTFVNQKDGFRVNVFSGDGKANIFLAADLMKKSDAPALKGYNGGQNVYVGLKGNDVVSFTTLSDFAGYSALYGSAPGRTYGFRWEFDAGDEMVTSFLQGVTKSPEVKVTFEDVYRNAVKPAGLRSEYKVNASWGDAPLTAERGSNSLSVTVPTENYYKYSSTRGAEMSLKLKFGSYTVNTVFNGGTGFTSTADNGGKDFIDKVSIKGKLTQHGGITLTYTFSDKTAAKALASKKITMTYAITANGKLIGGSRSPVTLLRAGKGNISKLSIEAPGDQVYTGKAIAPLPVIRDGYRKLVRDRDYTPAYRNNAKIGTASVVIKGKGAYKGKITVKFSIVPGSTTLAFRTTDAGKILSWRKILGADNYALERLTDGEFAEFRTLDGDILSYTLADGEEGTFRICARKKSGDKYICGAWSNSIEAL